MFAMPDVCRFVWLISIWKDGMGCFLGNAAEENDQASSFWNHKEDEYNKIQVVRGNGSFGKKQAIT